MQSQHFPIHPTHPHSQLLHSKDASSEPIISRRVKLYCTWHVLEWSHSELLSVFSFLRSKRKWSGLRQSSTIPTISGGTAAGEGSSHVLIEPFSVFLRQRVERGRGHTWRSKGGWHAKVALRARPSRPRGRTCVCGEEGRGDDLEWNTDLHDPARAPWRTPCPHKDTACAAPVIK